MFYMILAGLLGLDQLTKWLAYTRLQDVATVPVIPHVLHFTYVENRGIAFGMLQNMSYLFVPLSIAVTVVCLYLLYRAVKKKHSFAAFGIALVVAGAVGNLIDRICRGFVVDFIQLKFISFPVFNVADIMVTVGAILIAVYVLFLEGRQGEKHESDL